ncbi:hypothetical protein RJI07_01555 [Mycoplasmatota bacterium WC30]
MKKKDLIAKIRSAALNEMPEISNRIDISKVNIENKPESIRSPFNFKRALSYTFSSIFIIISGFMIYNFAYLPSIPDSTPLDLETEIVGFQTVSSAALLDNLEITELSYSESDYIVQRLSSSTTFDLEDQLDVINNYLSMAETVLGFETQFIYKEIESDNLEFAYAFQYNGTDLAGNLISYQGYYNIVGEGQNQIESGVLYHQDNTYRYQSFTTEIEGITFFQYRIEVDEYNYVEVKNNSNEDTQEFNYKLYLNGELNNESDLTLISDKNNLKAKIKIMTNSNEEIKLDLERNSQDSNGNHFLVNYSYMNQQGSQSGNFIVDLDMNNETGQYQYQYHYGNSQVIVGGREGKGNQPAESEDFNQGQNQGSNNPHITTTSQDESINTTEHGNGSSNSTGNPSSGNSTSGNSTAGHSTAGNSTAGNSTAGNSTSGNPTTENPDPGNDTSGSDTSPGQSLNHKNS